MSLFLVFFIIVVLAFLFFFLSKVEILEKSCTSVFECGFNSYFYSRFSFAMHYFVIGLTFLFFDLELCFLMSMILDHMSDVNFYFKLLNFIFIFLFGLVLEWVIGGLDWIY